MAISPDLPKQCSMVAWKELAPLSLELITINRMVQSTCSAGSALRHLRVLELDPYCDSQDEEKYDAHRQACLSECVGLAF